MTLKTVYRGGQMPDEQKGVNAVVEPPATIETEPKVPVVETPDANDVTPATPDLTTVQDDDDDKKLETEASKRGVSNVMRENKRKTDEIAELKRQLEERNSTVPVIPVPSTVPPVRDEIEILAEQMSEEAGDDEFGYKILPVRAAKVVVMNQLRIQHASTAGTRLESNVNEFIKKNPTASFYAEQIKLELSKLEPGVKDNPTNVERKFLEIRGKDTDRLIAEAEERGKKKALEQKRIVSQAAGEKPSGLPEGKSAEDMLSAEEKNYATKNKISYDDYYKAKGNKRV